MDPTRKKYDPRLEEVTLEISELTYRCHVWPVPRTQRHAGLIAFQGTYRPGSAGADDALFIRWRILELCDLRLPGRIQGLVVDLREMEYVYGDNLSVDDNPLGERGQPILVVARTEQIDALRGVIGVQRLRTDPREAFAEVADTLRNPRLSD